MTTADDESGGKEFTTEIALRWGDMDALGHLNNATALTLLEEARLRFLASGRGTDVRMTSLLAARNEIDYVIPVYYSLEPLTVRMWVSRIGRASFTIAAEVIDQSGALAIRCQTVMVCMAPDGSGSTPLPPDWRASLAQYVPRT